MRKPEKRCFAHVLRAMRCDGAETLFFDDNRENVEQAKRMGISSTLVIDGRGVRESLKKYKENDNA